MSIDPIQLRPWVRRVGYVALAFAFVLLWLNYGWLRVPAGMDTMPEAAPAGALCLVQKSPSSVPLRAVVFVDLPAGGTVVSRVVAVDGDQITVEHDDPRSSLGFGKARGVVPIGSVRALVLTTLTGNA